MALLSFCGVHREEIVSFTYLNCLSFKALSQGQCVLKRFTVGRLVELHNEFKFKFDRHVQTKTEAAVYLWLWFRAICNDKNSGCYPNWLSAHSNCHTFICHIYLRWKQVVRLNPHYENWIFGNCHAKYYKSVIIPTYAFIFQELQDKFGPHILTPT